MIASTTRIGWQTTLADLALILFMVTAAAMAEEPDAAERVAAGAAVPARGEPLAIYRAAPNAPPLADWLASQARDDRQHLTIVARHAPGDADEAARDALALARDAAAAGRSARIVIEPATRGDVIAVLDYDGRQSGTTVASSAPSANER